MSGYIVSDGVALAIRTSFEDILSTVLRLSRPMELKEVFHVDILPAAVASFAASWSDDDRVSILTEGGVHILELVPDPSNVSLNLTHHRTWLTPREVYPSKYTGIDINSLVWELDQCDVYDALLDVNLTPELPTARKHSSAVVQAVWSPPGLLPHSRCMLATVSNYGSVGLHEGWGQCWWELASLSQHYLDQCKANWDCPDLEHALLYKQLKERCAHVLTTSMCWGPLRGGCAYLVCGQLSGHILFWKVSAVTSPASSPLEPQLVRSLLADDKLHKILCLVWCPLGGASSMLLAGGYNGRISSWLIEEREDELACREEAVWPDEDRVSVQHLVALPRREPIVVAVKGAHLILLQFDRAGALLRTLPYTIGSREVTGAMSVDEDTLLVMTQDSRLYRLCVGDLNAGPTFTAQELQMDKNLGHWALCGLAASRHKMLIALVSRLCKVYDHLVHREPSQICFFKQPVNVDDLMSEILENPSQRLTKFWEHLEIIRLQSVADGCVPGLQFATEEQCLEEYSSYQLRVAIVLLNMVLAQSDSPETVMLLRNRVERMAILLCVRHMCERASKLVELAVTDKAQLASLGTIRLWLAKLLSRGDVDGPRTLQLVTSTANLLCLRGELHEEFCHVCSAKCSVDSHLEVSCPAGHALPRCSLTMLPCSSLPYLLCRTCSALALCDTDWQDEDVLCVYCDRHFVIDEKIRHVPPPSPLPSVSEDADAQRDSGT